MKIFTSLFFSFLFSFSVFAQQKPPAQPVTKDQNKKQKSFYEIQKEFYDYWAPYNIQEGYYYQNGQKIKVAGWKQFKRWEYYWEQRVNPKTGAFPTLTAADIYHGLKTTRGTTSSGGSWTVIGPNSSPGGYYGIGRFNCIGFRSGDVNTYYAGSPSGGLWKTTDNGSTWMPLTDNNDVLGVSAVALIPGTTPASDTIYIGTGDRDGGSMWSLGGGQSNDNNGIGILKSFDGGSTWNTTGLSFSASEKTVVTDILIDPSNHHTIYAATYTSGGGTSNTGLFKSTDGGASFTRLSNSMFVDLEFKPGDSQTIYAATKVGQIFISTDGGTTWTKTLDDYYSGGRRIELAVSDAQPTWVYAVEANSSNTLLGVYKSTDSGNSFSPVYDGSAANHNLLGLFTDGSGTTGQGGYDLALAVHPSDANTIYLGGIITFKSTDGGNTWTAVNCWTSSSYYNKNGAPVVHADKHSLRFRSDDNTLFETNDGGIYLTSDGGSSWTDKTNGTIPSQFYRLSVSQTSSSEVIGGLQDNGTKYYSQGSWANAIGGDGMECIIDYTDLNIQYGCSQNGYVQRTTNHWTGATYITRDPYTGNPINGLTETGYWVTPYIMNHSNHQNLFIGLENVWKSTDQGNNWTKISNINTSSKIRSLAVAPSNSQVIYAADPDQIWVTTNGGTTWIEKTGTLPVGSSSITYIAVKDDDPNTAWVTFGQYNAYGVYRTTDAGATWLDISSGLPSVPVMCIVQNKQEAAETELYAGTDVGVYIKRGDNNWTSFSNGLPHVVVTELEIYYGDSPSQSKLKAATFGRGIWESDLYSPPNAPPAAEFTADKRIASTIQTVYFTNLSTNTPSTWQWNFSPSTITYKNGTSTSSQNPEIQFNAAGTYTVELTASNANGSGTETKTAYININDYCAASGGGTGYIDQVAVGTIDNSGTASDGYTDYDSLSTQMKVGQAYTVTVHFGSAYVNDTIACWIDWNQDGDFDDSGEECFVEDVNSWTEYGTIQVPENATLGFTRMRIRQLHFTHYSPCGTSTYGEVEDYAIEVVSDENVWLGTSNQWNNTNNWSLGIIPTMAYDVIVPAAPSGGNFPVIPTGYTAKCNKIKLQNGATITVNGTLEVNQ